MSSPQRKNGCGSSLTNCEFAACEKRTLGNFGVPLLEWAVEQLQTAGSLTNLLKFRLAKRKPPP